MNKNITYGIIGIIIVAAAIIFFNSQQTQIDTLPATGPFKYIEPADTSRAAALASLLDAENIIQDLANANYATTYLQDQLYLAQIAFIGEDSSLLTADLETATGAQRDYLLHLLDVSKEIPRFEVEAQNYSKTIMISEFIAYKRKQIYNIVDVLSILDDKINAYESKQIDVVLAKQTLQKAREEFSKERYDDAEFLLTETNNRLEEAKRESIRAESVLSLSKNFIERNWVASLIVLVILIVLLKPILYKIRKENAKRKVSELQSEMKVISKLLIRAQEEYFKEKKITVNTYNILEEKYKSRLAEVKEKIPVYEAIAQGKEIKKTEEDIEKEKLTESVKKTQLRLDDED